MGDEQLQQSEWVQSAAAFQPSRLLRGRLMWGCLATILAGALGLAALATDDKETSLILELISLAPLTVMLWTYLLLAKEAGSVGLRRTMLGMLGIAGLMSLAGLAKPEFVDEGVAIAVGITFAVLAVILICVVCHRPAWAKQSAASVDGSPSDSSSTQQKAGWGGGAGGAFLIFILIKFFARGVLKKVQIGQEELAGLGLIVLILLFVVFSFIGGIVKLRLGSRLGMTSMLLGLTEFLAPLVLVGLFGWLMVGLVEIMETAGPNEADMDAAVDAFVHQWQKPVSRVAMGIHGVWTIMTLLFFWTVRGSADPNEVLSNEF